MSLNRIIVIQKYNIKSNHDQFNLKYYLYEIGSFYFNETQLTF